MAHAAARGQELEELHQQLKLALKEETKQLRLTQNYVRKLEQDNEKVKQAMKSTVDKLKSFSNDQNLVDRRLVVKMLVAYYENPKKQREVLELMARMFHFEEKDMQRIGVGPNAGLGNLQSNS